MMPAIYVKEPVTSAIDGRNIRKPVIKKNTTEIISIIPPLPPDILPPSYTKPFDVIYLSLIKKYDASGSG
jgi:hypothetical protein